MQKTVMESDEGQQCQMLEVAKRFLKSKFLNSSDQQSALSPLMALKQTNSQTLNDIHDKVQELGEVTFVNITAEASD